METHGGSLEERLIAHEVVQQQLESGSFLDRVVPRLDDILTDPVARRQPARRNSAHPAQQHAPRADSRRHFEHIIPRSSHVVVVRLVQRQQSPARRRTHARMTRLTQQSDDGENDL